MQKTIDDILAEAEEPRPAVSLQLSPLSTAFDEFYDILLDRWRAGERSPALADAIKRLAAEYGWLQLLFVDNDSMSIEDWGGRGLYRPNGPDWRSCRTHGFVLREDEMCSQCQGGNDD